MSFKLVACFLAVLAMSSVVADETIGLQFPVEDAREAVKNGDNQFVALDLDSGLVFPGLSQSQIDYVYGHYRVRALNQRWSSFSNIEERDIEMQRMTSYAKRYNMVLWAELEKHRIRDFKKYRY